MLNQNTARGIFLAAIALSFGLAALQYPIGDLSSAGPGLFPLIVSSLLLLLALMMIIQSRLVAPTPLSFNVKNIALIMAALGAFVVMAEFVNTMLGIVLLVFVACLTKSPYSWRSNVRISLGLIAIAYLFEHALGLNLGLLLWKF
jgi:hypothetical protein